jgi:chromate transporter
VTVGQKRWLDAETFSSGVALCQMLPGATAMQVAGYVGLKARGVRGAAASFIGFGLPAFLLMTGLAALYASTHNLPAVTAAFSGLQAIIVAILANAALSFGQATLKHWRHVVIAGGAAILFGLNANPIVVIGLAALAGLALVKSHSTAPPTSHASPPLPSTVRPLAIILVVAALGLLLLFLFQPALFDLSTLMLRVDLLAFGGGFSSVPLMFHEVVEVRHWLDGPTFMNGIVLGQVTPGPIVITATFIGYLLQGLPGAVIATLSIFLPSFTLMIGTTPYFDRLRASATFNQLIGGVLCSFVGLLLTVTVRLAWTLQWDLPHGLVAGAAFIALLLKVDLLWVVVSGVIISVVLFR